MPEPPYGTFDTHAADQRRQPHSSLIDPRWFEVILAKLKDVDDMTQRRQNLRDPGQSGYRKEKEPKGGRRPKGGGKGADEEQDANTETKQPKGGGKHK